MQTTIINKTFLLAGLKLHRNEIKAYGVKSLGLFGSFVRNTPNENSDIDLLVDFEPHQKLMIILWNFHSSWKICLEGR